VLRSTELVNSTQTMNYNRKKVVVFLFPVMRTLTDGWPFTVIATNYKRIRSAPLLVFLICISLLLKQKINRNELN